MVLWNTFLRSVHKTLPKIHKPHYSTVLITQTLPKIQPQTSIKQTLPNIQPQTLIKQVNHQRIYTRLMSAKSGGTKDQEFEKKHAYLGRLAKYKMGRKAASNFESWKVKGIKPDQNSYKLLIEAQINSNENVLAFKYINQWVMDYKDDLEISELNHFLVELAEQCEKKDEHEILRKISKLNRRLKIKTALPLPQKVRGKKIPRRKKQVIKRELDWSLKIKELGYLTMKFVFRHIRVTSQKK